jgi:uncharacterized membrane protein
VAGSCRTNYGTENKKKEIKLKKVILIIGLFVPWTAFSQDATFRDQNGSITGSAHRNSDGSWTYRDQNGYMGGSARPGYCGGWIFYDRNGQIVGSQDGQ